MLPQSPVLMVGFSCVSDMATVRGFLERRKQKGSTFAPGYVLRWLELRGSHLHCFDKEDGQIKFVLDMKSVDDVRAEEGTSSNQPKFTLLIEKNGSVQKFKSKTIQNRGDLLAPIVLVDNLLIISFAQTCGLMRFRKRLGSNHCHQRRTEKG